MRKPRARSGILKKLPRAPGGNCAQEGACPRHDKNLVRRGGPQRQEEQDPPPLGQARHPSKRTAGPTDRFHLHLRCSLPEGGQGCSPDHAGLQHRGDELAPRRDRRNRRARCPRHPPGRSSRLALVHPSPRAGQYHHHSAAATVPRAQPRRERLAGHARQLALQPHLQILRRSRRPLLCGMEQARRSALAHHVHRTAPMGPRVLINGIWYYAKANPGKINLASGVIGSPSHVSGELFKIMTGTDMLLVPYRGVAPALTDLISGQVQVMFAGAGSSIGHIKAGRLRALAVTTATRSEALPDIPTVGEFLPGYEASNWYGIGAPRNTPVEVIDKLNKEINAGLADPKIKTRLADLGGDVLALSPTDFGKLIAEETEKWGKVIRAANIKPE